MAARVPTSWTPGSIPCLLVEGPNRSQFHRIYGQHRAGFPLRPVRAFRAAPKAMCNRIPSFRKPSAVDVLPCSWLNSSARPSPVNGAESASPDLVHRPYDSQSHGFRHFMLFKWHIRKEHVGSAGPIPVARPALVQRFFSGACGIESQYIFVQCRECFNQPSRLLPSPALSAVSIMDSIMSSAWDADIRSDGMNLMRPRMTRRRGFMACS